MRPARIAAGVLGAIATVVVAMPLTRLFQQSEWLAAATAGVAVVAVAGMVARSLADNPVVIIAAQGLLGGWYLLLTEYEETTAYALLPTPATVTTFVSDMRQAYETVTTYAAPAPTTPGIAVALVLMIMVVAIAVDLAAATAAAPTIAGLPLLSLFLVSAANTGGELPWGWFVGGAALWLLMVARQSGLELRSWAGVIPILAEGDGEGRASRAHGWQAARLAVVGLALALLVPLALPHLPTRYVLDGLGRGDGGGVGTGDGIRLSTELDLRRSLRSPDDDPVLEYKTNDPEPDPLRVAVVTDFTDGFGRIRSTSPQPQSGFSPGNPLTNVSQAIPRDERTMEVTRNRVTAPQLAIPARTKSVDTGDVPWSTGADGTARVERSPSTYSTSSVELDLTANHFEGGDPSRPVDPDARDERYLRLDPGSESRIRSLARRLAPEDRGPLAAARAFQEYLRGPDFGYSLELPEPPGGPEDPILSFLDTKVGYCQQYAATMTLLARADGIPARTAVGFLPGTDEGDTWSVRASDAHTWPELYFEGIGWVRFEPTPGARAASVPAYSIATEGGDPAAEPTDTSTTTSEPTPTPSQSRDPQLDSPQAAPTQDRGVGTWVWWLLGLVVAVLALGLMPVSALLARRRAARRAADERARVEAEWQDLITRVGDLGMVPPVGATPRQTGTWLRRRAHLTEASGQQLDHVVATLESARYAPPGRELPDISGEVESVVDEVRGSRMRGVRVRAWLWPSAGVHAWRAIGRRLARPLRRER